MQVFLIDSLGPFFSRLPHHRFNWSKVPFARIEDRGRWDEARARHIEEAFDRFCRTVSVIGFNALSIDDLAHLLDDEAYPAELREKLARYRAFYRRLFALAAARGLAVYVTSDIMFYHDTLWRRLGASPRRVAAWLGRRLTGFFADHPEVRGIIFRFGECDEATAQGDFRSRLVLKTPRQARDFLRRLLPCFEAASRDLVFRTWSVGAYPLGDLQWNRNTFRRVFEGLPAERLVVSMKYGESDFFRYLPLNRNFLRGSHRMWIEFQARREYEGFGEYPSFVGRDVANYLQALRGVKRLEGCTVWCQTGGWSIFRRLTFLDDSSLWNEINTWVTLRLCRYGETVEEAVRSFAAWRWGGGDAPALMELLDLSDQVIKELLYVPQFASRPLYFRRLRVPPLLSVFWDQVLVNHSMRKTLRCFVSDGPAAIREGRAALGKLRRMQDLARELGLPAGDLVFQYDTFELLALAREYYFGPYDPSIAQRLRAAKQAYKQRHRDRYTFHLDFERVRVKGILLRALFRVLLRRRRGYRMVIDRVLVLHVLGRLYPLLRRLPRRVLPAFAGERAMGIDAIFK